MTTLLCRRLGNGFWLCLWVAFLTIVVAGLLCHVWQSSAPRYQGKTSAEWYREFQKAASRHFTIPVTTPTGPAQTLDLEGLQRDPASTGLRALGTNAAVYLGHEYAREDGRLARTYGQFYPRLPAPLKGLLPKPPVPRAYRRMGFRLALEALGTNASAAAPFLISTLRSGDRFTFQTTLTTLQRLEFDQHELDSLLEDWGKQARHTNVLRVVSELHVRTAVAARCLTAALGTGDRALRRSCIHELEQFGAAAAPAVPQLTAALQNPDDETRYAAARALEAIGSAAAPAVAALIQATNDTSVTVQRASARALGAIQGQHTD